MSSPRSENNRPIEADNPAVSRKACRRARVYARHLFDDRVRVMGLSEPAEIFPGQTSERILSRVAWVAKVQHADRRITQMAMTWHIGKGWSVVAL